MRSLKRGDMTISKIISIAIVAVLLVLTVNFFGGNFRSYTYDIVNLVMPPKTVEITSPGCTDCVYIKEYRPAEVEFTNPFYGSDNVISSDEVYIEFSEPVEGTQFKIYKSCLFKPRGKEQINGKDIWQEVKFSEISVTFKIDKTGATFKNLPSQCYILIELEQTLETEEGDKTMPDRYRYLAFKTG